MINEICKNNFNIARVLPMDINNRINERRLERNAPIANSHTLNVKLLIAEEFKKTWLTSIIGIVLCIVGICVLFWNEGRAASFSWSLDEALENVVSITNLNEIPEEYNGHLVHIAGVLSVNDVLTEPDYGVAIECVKLKRRVQMYQWVEIEEDRFYAGQIQEDKNYYYVTEWRDRLIDSDQFYIRTGHENPKEIPIKSQIQIADQVKIGNINFGLELKKKFTDFAEITSDSRPESSEIKMHSGLYYHSADLWNPRVGDIRILFSFAGRAGDVYSVIGKLEEGTIVPFVTIRGDEILLLRKNNLSVDKMFHLEHVHNYWRTWLIRFLGWLITFCSTNCLSNILKVIIQSSNLLCSILKIESLNMSVSMSITLLIISSAWIWYRPFIAICLGLISVLPFFYSSYFLNNLGNQAQQRNNYRRL